MNEKSMMIVEATWQEKKTFRLIPITESCPYVECIFDPETKVFVVISKIKKTSLHMLPKLDEYGQPSTGTKGIKQERHKIEVFQEFYVEDKVAIKDLLHLFATNAETFDFEVFMISEEVTSK
jgi:hypothetical protein